MPTSKESFSQRVKRELAKNKYAVFETKTLLAALLKQRAELVIANGTCGLEVRLKSPATLQLVYSSLKEIYGAKMHTGAGDSLQEGGYRVYELAVSSQIEKIIAELHLSRDTPPKQTMVTKRSRWAYLVGAFLGGGVVSNPSAATPNFEISCANEHMAHLLLDFFAERGFNLKVRERRGYFVCYLKKADRIVDLLKLLNAPEATLAFEDARISRDLTWQLSKLNNIDIANQQKVMGAAKELISRIETLRRSGKMDGMSAKLALFCRLRVSRPNATLSAIAAEMTKRGVPVTKAGLNHYGKQIKTMAMLAKGTR